MGVGETRWAAQESSLFRADICYNTSAMSPLGRIFGRGRQLEKLLKKAEDAFREEDWEASAEAAGELRNKIEAGDPGKFATELARALYLEAASHQKREDFPGALRVIEKAVKDLSDPGEIARVLAEIAFVSDDEAVLPLLERASGKWPESNPIALALCSKYVKEERFDERTLPLFSRMHQRAPDNRQVLYGLAMCLKRLEKFDRTSLAVYRRAFHEYSTNNEFLYALSRTYASQRPPVNEALPVIERALKFFPEEEAFHKARVSILANLPSLTPDHVRLLLEAYKKSKDQKLAEKLVDHLLAAHADDEDACRVYEAVWRDHPKRTALLTILAERYRLSGRKDKAAMEIFQAFFDDMPRERENTLYLARRYAEANAASQSAILVYQQALRDGTTTDVDPVVLALARGYLALGRRDEEAARVYRMAHNAEPENYDVLTALKDVAMAGGRMDGARANPLIDYIKDPNTETEVASALARKLGESLASEGRKDADACDVYRLNVADRKASEAEEELLVEALVEGGNVKLADSPLIERVYRRTDSEKLAATLAELYRESGKLSRSTLPIVVRTLEANPSNRKLAVWALPYLLDKHGQDEKYFPLLATLIVKGHLSAMKDVKPGLVAGTATRIARDRIREGAYKAAIEILGEAFKFDPNPILQYLLGVSYQGSGDFTAGLAVFKDLIKSEKENAQYRYRSAVLKLISGDLSEAEKDLDELAKRFPDHALVHLRKGMLLEAREDRQGALAEYELVRTRDKAVAAFAEYRKGMLLCSKGDWREGLKLLDRAAGGGIQSPTLDSARLVACVILADEAMKSGSLDPAEKLLKAVAEVSSPPWPQVATERLIRLALLRLEANDEKGAQRALEVAEKTGTRDSRVGSLLALIDIQAGRPKASVERLERALTSRDPAGAELAHRLWAAISIRLGRHDEGRESADWLVARKAEGAVRLRFLAVWRDPLEIDWPPALENWTYEGLENELCFPVGLIGRMAYKRADYEGGAKYLEKYHKDQSKPDKVEAEFLLGLMYIKQKKANLGLHYWGHILEEGHRDLSGRQRVEALMLLGYHFLEHGETERSREAFKLAKEAGAEEEEIARAISYSYLQAGHLAAKVDNMRGAIREWERILESSPNDWQALQNLGLAHFLVGEDEKATEYFDQLFSLCEEHPGLVDEETLSFLLEETRKMINQLVSLKQSDTVRAEVKREILVDEIRSANRHYWTLGVKKGATSEEAQANYFRLVKIYNPEKYPEDFMILESAYEFFNKPGQLKKNEQRVFNAFNFRLLGLESTGGLTEIPPSAQITEFLREALDPRRQVDISKLLEDSFSRKDAMPVLNAQPDFACPDYLASWE